MQTCLDSFRDDLTVVILTKDRPNSLKQIVKYWNDLKIQTIIVDGSLRPISLKLIGSKTRYFHAPISIRQRSELASSLISTKYAIMGTDDEVFLESGLRRLHQHLEKNPKIVSVGGATLAVWKYGPRICGHWPYKRNGEVHINAPSPTTRIRSFFGKNNRPALEFINYNLVRTDVLVSQLQLMSRINLTIGEFSFLFVSLMKGGIAHLPVLYLIRNWNRIPRSSSDVNRKFKLKEWLIQNSHLEESDCIKKEFKNLYDRYVPPKSIKKKTFDADFNQLLRFEEMATSRPIISKIGVFWHNLIWIRYLKYGIRKYLLHNSPSEYKSVLAQMNKEGVQFERGEIEQAVQVVARLYDR